MYWRIEKLLKNTLNKIKIDYEYIHYFNDKKLNLEYEDNNFEKNVIIYILKSNFDKLKYTYKDKKHLKITDLFVQDISFTKEEFLDFFSYKFLWLFWLRFFDFNLKKELYSSFIDFLELNLVDLNRLYLENLSLTDDFFYLLSDKIFKNNILTFINFDSNNFSENWFNFLQNFILNNCLKLEYLSISNNNLNLDLSFLDKLNNLRILDISWNKIDEKNQNILLNFIKKSSSIKEIYLKNINLSKDFLDEISVILQNKKLENIVFSPKVSENNPNNFWTFFIKYFDNVEEFESIKKPNFLLTNSTKENYDEIILQNHNNFIFWINLFLFDIHNYDFIFKLLKNYNFNYIYFENYYINDEDFILLIENIKLNSNKFYKINFISINLNNFQLEYLLNNFPSNISFIEISLNKVKNLEKHLLKLVKNEKIIFEQSEIFRKIIN